VAQEPSALDGLTPIQMAAIMVGGAVFLAPLIALAGNWMGIGKRREITPQPLMVQAAAKYMDRDEYKEIAAACAMERRQAFASAKQDREAVERQIDHLATTIRVELKEHNAHAEERANELHGRITAFVGPLDALRARVDDHIHDSRAHVKGNHS